VTGKLANSIQIWDDAELIKKSAFLNWIKDTSTSQESTRSPDGTQISALTQFRYWLKSKSAALELASVKPKNRA
jgi:hypothetical protein